MWLYRLESIKVSYHSTKFGGQWHSVSGDIMVFVYQVILQDHVIKALNDFMFSSLSRSFITLPSLIAIGTVAVKM